MRLPKERSPYVLFRWAVVLAIVGLIELAGSGEAAHVAHFVIAAYGIAWRIRVLVEQDEIARG